jgi:hypothetical protein
MSRMVRIYAETASRSGSRLPRTVRSFGRPVFRWVSRGRSYGRYPVRTSKTRGLRLLGVDPDLFS